MPTSKEYAKQFKLSNWASIGRGILDLPDTVKGGKQYAHFVLKWSQKLTGTADTHLKNHVAIPVEIRRAFDKYAEAVNRKGYIQSFFGCTSAKVRHSAQHSVKGVEKWFNAVMYLSPADQAALSFCIIAPNLVRPLIENIRKAAAQYPEWKPFALVNASVFEQFLTQIEAMKAGGVIPENLPSLRNAVRPLSMCPDSSPVCRAVCLNVSGQAAMNITGETEADVMLKRWLGGGKSYYAGATNAILAARIARTHTVWGVWATEGVIQNSLNDHWFFEAMQYRKVCDAHGTHLALRFNGTSDIPVETLKLTNGRPLVSELGRIGAVCYDYTKSYLRMKNWLSARAWKPYGSQKGVVRKGFPDNYWLSFSWSEVGLLKIIDVLRSGGNIVAVFRKSEKVKNVDVGQLSTGGERKAAAREGARPRFYQDVTKIKISLNDLTGGLVKDTKPLRIINGDITDLRFTDPYLAGKAGGGCLVWLMGKTGAEKPYGAAEHARILSGVSRHFVFPVELTGDNAEVRTNPPRLRRGALGGEVGVERSSIVSLDSELSRSLAIDTGTGFVLGTTAQGT